MLERIDFTNTYFIILQTPTQRDPTLADPTWTRIEARRPLITTVFHFSNRSSTKALLLRNRIGPAQQNWRENAEIPGSPCTVMMRQYSLDRQKRMLTTQQDFYTSLERPHASKQICKKQPWRGHMPQNKFAKNKRGSHQLQQHQRGGCHGSQFLRAPDHSLQRHLQVLLRHGSY